MPDQNDKIVQKVVSRLTELRAEFGPEERVILDGLVVGDGAEVSGHAFDFTAPGRIVEEGGSYKVVDL
jgi:hypothetical protein